MTARYEVVTAARDRHWARYIASNGKEVWRTSETYKRKQGAVNAVCVIASQFIQHDNRGDYVWDGSGRVEVRYVDQRLVPTPRPTLPEPGAVAS